MKLRFYLAWALFYLLLATLWLLYCTLLCEGTCKYRSKLKNLFDFFEPIEPLPAKTFYCGTVDSKFQVQNLKCHNESTVDGEDW